MRACLFLLLAAVLAGCQVTTGPGPRPVPTAQPAPQSAPGPRMPATRARAEFQRVVERVMPVATRICRNRLPRGNCAFRVGVDERPGLPPNAFQTLDRSGRPVIGFTAALLGEARNSDELAFVLGHEAAHHIAGHIPQAQRTAATGAILGTVAAGILGLEGPGADVLTRSGAQVGSRIYSKEFELEADRLGTLIAHRAGYNPVRGSRFFARIPDPGDRFLGSHPPNADRVRVVRETAAGLR